MTTRVRPPRRSEKRRSKRARRLLLATVISTASFIAPPSPSTAEAPPAEDSVAFPTEEHDNPEITPLLEEAQTLFDTNRPIDGRAKLLDALKKAPEDYRPHMALGGYYLTTVANFQLALRYLRTAEELFLKQYGPEKAIAKHQTLWRQHARLLIFLTETRINLDNYQGALETMDRFEALYSTGFDWYPGTRAWVLMKLRRVDEAIRVAQAGLLAGADPGRTYNILGILVSLKGNRKLALDAFAQSIRAEQLTGGAVATPLNNAGEVYREFFSDTLAESAWRKAVQLPDGCEHILFSLNLAMLYIEQLRLFQAERVLDDFEACFAQHSIRADSEHRALLALARGRIALRMGDIEKAVPLLTLASERQQWFGKIGTDEEDMRFAATVGLSDVLKAKQNAAKDTIPRTVEERVTTLGQGQFLRLRSWWLGRRATEIALDELNDFEDLYVRNTDAMLEYPALGRAIRSFPTTPVARRLDTMRSTDPRPEAQPFYDQYQAWTLLFHGEERAALPLFRSVVERARRTDRLLTAEAYLGIALSLTELQGWFSSLSPQESEERRAALQELFLLLPSQIRFADLALPVRAEARGERAERVLQLLKRRRFESDPQARFLLRVSESTTESAERLSLVIVDTRTQQNVVQLTEEVAATDDAEREFANKCIAKAFLHRVDPPGEPLQELEILNRAYDGRD